MQRRTDKQTSSQKLRAAAGVKLNGGCRPLLKGLYVTLLSPNLSFAGAGRAVSETSGAQIDTPLRDH